MLILNRIQFFLSLYCKTSPAENNRKSTSRVFDAITFLHESLCVKLLLAAWHQNYFNVVQVNKTKMSLPII